jgi:hypothetical protein
MSFEPFEFGAEMAEEDIGGGYVYVPDGAYLSELVGISPSPESRDGQPYFAFRWRLTDGQKGGIGRTLTDIASLSPKARWKLRGCLRAAGANPATLIGVKVPTYKTFVGLAKALEQKLRKAQTGLEVIDDERDGKPVSAIARYFDVAEWDSYRPADEASTTGKAFTAETSASPRVPPAPDNAWAMPDNGQPEPANEKPEDQEQEPDDMVAALEKALREG